MAAPDEEQSARTEEPAPGAPVSPDAEFGDQAFPESSSVTTGPEAPVEAPATPESEVEPWTVNTDLTQLSAEQIAEGLKNPDNAQVLTGHLLRDKDYRGKTTKLAEDRRRLEEIRGDTINLEERRTQANSANTEAPPLTRQNNEERVDKLIEEFQEEHPDGDGRDYAMWADERVSGQIDEAVNRRVQPLLEQQQKAQVEAVLARVDGQYDALVERYPHAADPGVREAVYEQMKDWDPDIAHIADDFVEGAYWAVARGDAAQPAASAPQAPQEPQPARAQSLPPAAKKGKAAPPQYDNTEDMIAAMMADKEKASKLEFPGPATK